MIRRQRHLSSVTCGVFVAALSVFAGGTSHLAAVDPPDTVIDEFDYDAGPLQLTCPAMEPVTDSVSDASIIGGEVDLALGCTTTQNGSSVGTAQGSVASGGLTAENSAVIPLGFTATWDGPDGSPDLDATGLGGIDLTLGGRKDVLELVVSEVHGAPNEISIMEITVYTDANNYSDTWGPLLYPGMGAVPLLGWHPGGGTGADFTNVGAISIRLLDETTAGPTTIGSLRTGTLAHTTMTDVLVDDVNGDGLPNPGDTIEYTVTAVNSSPAEVGQNVDEGVFTIDPAPGGSLVGAVTTSQGSVTSATDDDITVDIGTLVGGASATIKFRVVAGAAGTLSNQGHLDYAYILNPSSPAMMRLDTTTDTDDTDTPVFSDPTITAIVEAVPVVANDDSSATTFEVPVTGNVLTNDTGPEGALVASLVGLPTNGTVVFNTDGSFTYTPAAGFSGTDTFTYQATSTITEESDEGTVTITVAPPDVPAVANPDSYDTAFGAPVTGNVLTNDTGPAGPITAELVDAPTNGSLVLAPDGTFTYTPDAGFSGADVFTYRAIGAVTGPSGPTGPVLLALPGDVGAVTITVAAPPDTTPPDTTPPDTTVPPTTPPADPTLPPPPTTAPLAPTIAATLPATGSDSSGLVVTALLVLGLGAALTIAVRKRRHI